MDAHAARRAVIRAANPVRYFPSARRALTWTRHRRERPRRRHTPRRRASVARAPAMSFASCRTPPRAPVARPRASTPTFWSTSSARVSRPRLAASRRVPRRASRAPLPSRAVENPDDAAEDRIVVPEDLATVSPRAVVELDPDAEAADAEARAWYIPDFLDADDAAAVAEGCAKLRKKLKADHSFANGRLSAMIPMTNPAYVLFAGADVERRLRERAGVDGLRAGDFPMETRLYRPGADMGWHQDVRLYERPQHELIYTVSNESDARTQWRGSDGVVRSVRPAPNSALLFRADAAWHRVAPATEGERTIVKALYCEDFAKTALFSEVMASAPWRR